MSIMPRRGGLAPSLRSRLLLLVAAVALPLMLLAAGVIYASYLGDRERAEDRLREQAHALALVVDRELDRIQAVLETLAASPALADGDLAGFDRQLRAAAAWVHDAPIALLDPDDRQVVNSGWPKGVRRTGISGPNQLRAVFHDGQPVITDLFLGSTSHRLTLAIGVPVFKANASGGATGEVAYVLAAGVRSTALGALLAEQHLPAGWVGGVLDRNFRVVARTSDAARYVGTLALPGLHAAMLAADAGVVRAPRVDGVPSSTVFARAPASGLTVAIAVPDDLFAAPFRSALWRTLMIGALVSGGGLGLALLMARRIAAAIQGLADGGERPRRATRLREVELAAERLARTAAQRDAAEAALRAIAERLEQQVAERTEALADSEARLRGVFDAQFQYITLLSPEGRRLEMNRAVQEFRGAGGSASIGQLMWDAPWYRDSPATVAMLKEAVARAANGGWARFETRAVDGNGRLTILDMSIRPVRDPKSDAVRMLVAEAHDITDLRGMELRLAQTSRLEALGQLAGGVAHDFNNVLQSITGGIALIARRADDPAAVRRMTGLVNEAVSRGTSVTRRLLGFARRDALHAAPVDVADLLGNLREVLTHTLGSAIKVVVDAPPGLPPLLADRAQLETVLVNLATNARDAMETGGTLRLAATAEQVLPMHGAPVRPGTYIRLTATDSGAGMDAATLARAMEPFFTTKAAGKGTGLGLAMARGFAEQSGGTLAIDSVVGRGTTVSLWLPQAAGSVDAPAPAAPRTSPSRRQHLLLVEDSDTVRETLAEALSAQGYVVAQAADGEAAMAMLETAAAGAGDAMVDLLISDLSMPGMSGLDLIRTAQRRWPRLPAILLTGYAGEAATLAVGEALSGSSFILLRKPVSPTELGDRAAALLEQRGSDLAANDVAGIRNDLTAL